MIAETDTTFATESPVCITVNGIAHAVMMATPADLEDFALGFAFSEGIINDHSQIRDIQINAGKHKVSSPDNALLVDTLSVDILISPRQFQTYKEQSHFRRGLTSCGICGSHAITDALPQLSPLSGSKVPTEGLLAQAPMQLSTAVGKHSAQLFTPLGKTLVCYEDIGRHNALDKVIGYALRHALDLDQHYVVLSSRCSVELVQKAVRAGLSSLVHLSSPSDLALATAKFYRLNLIQVLRTGEIKIHSNSQHLSGES